MSNQSMEFKTEIKQILNLIIHSLYSNRDIFLRELISNASDAIDKIRFDSLTNKEILEDNADWKIKLICNEKEKTLTVSDNGIGMSEKDIVENLGTIARSGTKMFLENLKDIQNKPELIGQFGVGFYSAFMVADKVTVLSRTAGDKDLGVRWESAGENSFSVEPFSKEYRGTEVTLHLKEEFQEYLKEWKIRDIIKKYSDYVEHPILMDVEREENKKKTIKEETLNSRKAIWLKSKSEITEGEYYEFYKHISSDWNNPLETIHFSAEGTQEFKALLYLPSKPPFDLFHPDRQRGIHLYVRRIFISDDCKNLMPEYLRFVRGVVDSSDLPLNVSRELLQENPLIVKIKKGLINKVLAVLKEMQEHQPERYSGFYKEFGKVLKEGMHTDTDNREKLQDLLLFESTKTEPGKWTSLKECLSRMPQDQKEIYYLSGESRSELESSPYIEVFKKKNYEVLLMTDPIDEWMMQSFYEYNKIKFKSLNKGQVDLENEDEKKSNKEKEKQFKDLFGFIKSHLPDLKEVRLSNRLTDSACCLVTEEGEMSAHMERIFKNMNQDLPQSKRILELNPQHSIIETMYRLFEKDKKHPKLTEYTDLLYDQALMNEGSKVRDPLKFTKRINALMTFECQTLV